jgi:hippurate hydrolase
VDPLEAIVVSVTKFHAGDAHNVIPNESKLGGTIRTLDGDIREYGEKRLREITQSVADAYGCEVQLEFRRGYPVTVNHDIETEIATQAASAVVGAGNIDINTPPLMGGEDFSYMLEARPGAMILIGNGESAGLHHPKYDFNDEIIPYGISYWAQIAEQNPAR